MTNLCEAFLCVFLSFLPHGHDSKKKIELKKNMKKSQPKTHC